MKCYVINLDRAPERYAAFCACAKRTALEVVRVAAVDGRSEPIPEAAPWRAFWLHGRPYHPANAALTKSCAKTLRLFLETEDEHALICEDDAVLPENMAEILEETLQYSDTWDILRLNGLHTSFTFPNRLFPYAELTTCDSRLNRIFGWFNGTGAYVVNRHAADVILKHLAPYYMPFDHYLQTMYYYGLKTAIAFPYPVTLSELAHTSTIACPPAAPLWKKLFRVQYLTALPYRGMQELIAWCFQARNLIWKLMKNL